MLLFALKLSTAVLCLSASLMSEFHPHSLFSMLLPDLLLVFLNSLTFPPSCLINYTGLRSQLLFVALVLKSKLSVAPKYLQNHIRSPLSATAYRPLRSLDRQVLFVPGVRTTMAQTRSFATIGPFLWSALSSSLRSTMMSGSLATSLSLFKTYFYSRGVRAGSSTVWSLP